MPTTLQVNFRWLQLGRGSIYACSPKTEHECYPPMLQLSTKENKDGGTLAIPKTPDIHPESCRYVFQAAKKNECTKDRKWLFIVLCRIVRLTSESSQKASDGYPFLAMQPQSLHGLRVAVDCGEYGGRGATPSPLDIAIIMFTFCRIARK